jgi:tetratricopeptide (TPR) repeat protein
MKYSLVLLGCSAALVIIAQPVSAKTPAEIEQIARSVSVEMISGVGSGVLVHRQGDLYTIVTNRHVVCVETKLCDESGVRNSYQLKTIDGQVYKVGRSAIKLLKDAGGNKLDLAIVQFRSGRNYAVAQVAEPGSLKVEDAVYTAGFPKGQGFLFRQGKAQAVVNKRLVGDKGGYTVVYNAETLPGMSGGGAFNSEGRLVAIHGQGDKFTENTEAGSSYVKAEVNSKIGFNRGIPIRWVLQGLGAGGIVVGNRRLPGVVQDGPVAAATADEFFIAGYNKFVEPGADVRAGRKESVRQLSRAIALNPKYTTAYLMRAIVNENLGNYSPALADYNQAISLNPKLVGVYINRGNVKDKLNDPQGALADYNQSIALNPKDPEVYINRGKLKHQKLNDSQGALADYDQAITLNPKLAEAYSNRGVLKYQKLNNPQGALADYNQAITLNPKYAGAYNNRGLLKVDKLNDLQGALADYNQSTALDPKYADAYYNRGNLKYQKLSDTQGALADYNQAIALNPKYVEAYCNRGILKKDKNDPKGALADFNQSIVLNRNFAEAYGNRGVLKAYKLNDRPGAIQDFRAAARLFRQQGRTTEMQTVIELLRALGATE